MLNRVPGRWLKRGPIKRISIETLAKLIQLSNADVSHRSGDLLWLFSEETIIPRCKKDEHIWRVIRKRWLYCSEVSNFQVYKWRFIQRCFLRTGITLSILFNTSGCQPGC